MPPTTPTAARHVRRPPSRAATAALVALTLLVVPGPPADAVPAAERADRAGSTTAAARVSDPALARSLAAVMRDSRVRHGSSATVADTAGGAVLYSRYGSTARTPASNLKLVTAAAAMDTLGPGYRFRTEVLRVAAVRNGVLGGDLWIKGYGDPTTRQQDYASLARQVRAAGIRRVSGHLDVDVSWFDGQSYHPAWSRGYADDYYAAQVRPLTIAPTTDYDAGTVLVSYRPGRRGQRPTVSTVPAAAIKGLTLSNRATTSGSATRIAISRRSDSRTITVTGHVRAGSSGGSVQIAVGSPHLVAAAVFRDELRKAGVAVSGSTRVRSVPARRADGSGAPQRVALDRSMTLAQLLVPFLKLSNNSHAEALTKTLGRVAGGAGSWSAGTTVTRRYLARSGVPLAGVRLVDGSGLSRSDRLTTRATVALLARVTREPWFAAYSAALPVAGDSRRMVGGTLRSRMTGTAAAGNARAKTGSLTGVTGLSGYVRGADGRRYAFSMISAYSTRTPRPVEDRLVVTLARWRR